MKWFGLIWRGMLMGLAEVVPGVSGGTIAFVTGIYRDLVLALSRFGLASFTKLLDWREFIAYHRLEFLVPLGLGMGLGIVLFARLMGFLLEAYQPVVWAFFCGLILMSVFTVARQQPRTTLVMMAPLGVLVGLGLLLLPQLTTQPSYMAIFFGGAIAVCAWLLPAVSGSFMLLTLGLYVPVIQAVGELQIDVLAMLASGCVCGVLAFAKGLAWLLHTAQDKVFGFFTGFMLGSVAKLWPWQSEEGMLLDPNAFAVQVGESFFSWCIAACIVGALVMYALASLSSRYAWPSE